LEVNSTRRNKKQRKLESQTLVEWRGRLGLGTAGPSLNILNLINWILINFLRAENDKGSSIKKEIKKK
jgi:hypothetical protein